MPKESQLELTPHIRRHGARTKNAAPTSGLNAHHNMKGTLEVYTRTLDSACMNGKALHHPRRFLSQLPQALFGGVLPKSQA